MPDSHESKSAKSINPQSSPRRRSFWGWGWEDAALGEPQRSNLAAAAAARMGISSESGLPEALPIPRIEQLDLGKPRIEPPGALRSLFTSDTYERAAHTYGKSFKDVLRGLLLDYSAAPDLVAFPRKESVAEDVSAILEWCSENRIAVIPYGGGSSVVGGVEPVVGDSYRGVVSLDMRNVAGVEDIDTTSLGASILAGSLGPRIEDDLRPHGLTLRHFPQSFEFSSLGGWIATRSGGHYATLYTHIDDFVEALVLQTPAGQIETRRLPGSGAGPSPDRLFIGSEGILGVIVRAWMRVQRRPVFRSSADARFDRFEDGVAAARAIAQSRLYPANCRLLDPAEALLAGGDGKTTILVLGFESANHPMESQLEQALEIVRLHGGRFSDSDVRHSTSASGTDSGQTRSAAAETWRTAFIRAPYGRDALVRSGFVTETFETAVTWDKFEELHRAVVESVQAAIEDVCGRGWLSCRFTHVYPDGPAPYYTVVALGHKEPRSRIRQWNEIKAAASEAILSKGGTITHHHAVGRDHMEWYRRQIPRGFASALAAAKRALDPSAILNPGVLVDPEEGNGR
jgi:alkyldihydroxyacetonephosphate synthase